MIEEQAIVVRTQGHQALLEIERSQPCGLCGSTQGCGVSLWGRIFGGRRGAIRTDNLLRLEVGERVIIGMPEGGLLGSAVLGYLTPLLLLCLGAWWSTLIAGDHASTVIRDIYSFFGALSGLLAGLGIVRFLAANNRHLGRYQPVMLRRAETAPLRNCAKNSQ